MRLDSDAALPFEVHGVKHLRMHLARGERAGQLQQPVRERGFAVINVRDDREIADKLAVHEKKREAEEPASGYRRQSNFSSSRLIIASAMASKRSQPIQ